MPRKTTHVSFILLVACVVRSIDTFAEKRVLRVWPCNDGWETDLPIFHFKINGDEAADTVSRAKTQIIFEIFTPYIEGIPI